LKGCNQRGPGKKKKEGLGKALGFGKSREGIPPVKGVEKKKRGTLGGKQKEILKNKKKKD